MGEENEEFTGGGTPIGAIRPPVPQQHNQYAPSEPMVNMGPHQGMNGGPPSMPHALRGPPNMMMPHQQQQQQQQAAMIQAMNAGMYPPGLRHRREHFDEEEEDEQASDSKKGTVDKMKGFIKDGWKETLTVVILFLVLNAPIVYKYMGKFLPDSVGGGSPSILAVILNAILAGVIFYAVRKCLIKK